MLFLCRAKLIQLKKIKIGAVTYLNTKPLIYGMQQEVFLRDHELILAYPAQLAGMLKRHELDVALVPVALLAELQEYSIVSDYCIASNEEVASVCLFSERPLSDIRKVYLDYQSKTSVALLKILFSRHWKQPVEWLSATDESYIEKIEGDTAGLIIGDRALHNSTRFAYRYDLATAWKEMTGLPFVFAVWVSLRPDMMHFKSQLDAAQLQGISDLDQFAGNNEGYDLHRYYHTNISYELNDDKKKGMQRFIDFLTEKQ
jgi:chorismate dehydratase